MPYYNVVHEAIVEANSPLDARLIYAQLWIKGFYDYSEVDVSEVEEKD